MDSVIRRTANDKIDILVAGRSNFPLAVRRYNEPGQIHYGPGGDDLKRGKSARYLLLIYADEKLLEDLPEEEQGRMTAAHRRYAQDLVAAGKLGGGQALEPTSTATTVRVKEGDVALVADGPYAETKEQLGGFYIIDATDLDEAIDWAKKVPEPDGWIEIRPMVETPETPPS